MCELNELMTRWRKSLADLSAAQVQELEDHLRAEMEQLRERDLNEREAFIVATMRCGRPGELAEEFTRAEPTGHRL